jgi:hypothetical protein
MASFTVGYPNLSFRTGYDQSANNYVFAESVRDRITAIPEPNHVAAIAALSILALIANARLRTSPR